ncbi:MAG: M23 family metallopeptidase [Rickettsiales bacterium]
MMRSYIRTTFAVSLVLATAACSQTAARVDYRGQNVYAKSGVKTYSMDGRTRKSQSRSTPSYFATSKKQYTPPAKTYAASSYEPYEPAAVYTNTKSTTQNATIQSVAVNDLAPPAKQEVAKAQEPKPVRLWTPKSRGTSTKTSSEDSKPIQYAKPRKSSSSYMWPINSRKVVSSFGPKGAGKANDGINIASAAGEPIWAAADGEVVHVGNKLAGYGNMVLIKHPGGKTTTYAHMGRATVNKYDRVKQGDIIGYVGSSGNVSKSQLHFAIHDGKKAVNPKKYLSTSVAGL